mgnify:CR=1 FL=1|jgi:hypothetical protein
MGSIKNHEAGCEHSDFEDKAASFESVYQRIVLDAKTTDGADQVCLDSPQMVKKVRAYVRSLLNGTTTMDGVMDQSYIHKNGFQKIVLGRKSGFAMRFHSYLPDEGDQNVHDHRWSRLDSLVLEGSLPADYLVYSEPTDCGAEKWERHEYCKAGDDYVVKHQGETYLAPDERVLHSTGELYSMDAKCLHRILPATEPVATLVVTHPVPAERVWCNLYQKHIIEELEPVHEVRLTRQQMMASLTHLEELLTQHIVRNVAMATLEGVWA